MTTSHPNLVRTHLATATAALLLLGAGVSSADPANRPHPGKGEIKTLAVDAHYTEPAGSWDGAECSGLSTASPSCGARLTGYATFTGTLYGKEYYDLVSRKVTPDGQIGFDGAGYFTGGVQGCGKGSYTLDMAGSVEMGKYDPVTTSTPASNEWRYRPGSGTGELTNLVSGSGVNHFTVYWSGAVGVAPVFGEGDFTGTIRCRR